MRALAASRTCIVVTFKKQKLMIQRNWNRTHTSERNEVAEVNEANNGDKNRGKACCFTVSLLSELVRRINIPLVPNFNYRRAI